VTRLHVFEEVLSLVRRASVRLVDQGRIGCKGIRTHEVAVRHAKQRVVQQWRQGRERLGEEPKRRLGSGSDAATHVTDRIVGEASVLSRSEQMCRQQRIGGDHAPLRRFAADCEHPAQ
jgi:hypothetical protein